MMLIPYRAKNPPERFPYVTYGLIAANILTYAVTSDYLLHVSDGAREMLAFSNDHLTPLRMLTALFVHANPFHLLGNMLFLWIFGQAVEGRLGPVKYIALYLLAGFAGDFLQLATIGQADPQSWNYGASGAIMGLAGAYLYMFPFASICVFYQFWFRFGLADWAAQWVILYFLAFDLIDGLIYQGMDGVGHFAHIGGAALGFFLPMLLRMARDSEQASSAQAMRTDARGDYSILALHELEALVERSPGDVNLLMMFCQRAAMRSDSSGPQRCMEVIRRHADALLAQADPDELARMLLNLPEMGGNAPTSFLMRLGAKLETVGSYETATQCYRRIYNMDSTAPDAQTALIRWARLTEQIDHDKRNAAALYIELLQQFPNGSQSMYAESALRRLGIERPKFVLSAGNPPAGPPTADTPPSAESTPISGSNGLAPITSRTLDSGSTAPIPVPSALETAYNVGETRGMVLRPIGSPAENG